MKNKVFALILTFIIILPNYGGNSVDSLKNVLQNTDNINDKTTAYLQLSKEYQHRDLDTARLYADFGMNLAKQMRSDENIAEAYACIGDVDVMQDELVSAAKNYGKAVSIFRELNKNNNLEEILLLMGNLSLLNGNYTEAMNYYLEGMEICKENNLETRLPHYYNNIGIIYMRLNEQQKALEHYLSALQLFEKIPDTSNIAMILGNIGSIYAGFGDVDIAKEYFYKSLKLYKEVGMEIPQAQLFAQIGVLFLNDDDADSAIYYFNRGKETLENTSLYYKGPRSAVVIDLYIKFGSAYYVKNDFNNALKYLRESFNIGILTNQMNSIRQTSELLSMVFEKQGLPDSAYHYYKIFKLYSDSLANEENLKELARIELEHEYEKQLDEQQQMLQEEKNKQRRNRTIFIVVFAGLLLVILIFILLLKLEKSKKAKIELQKEQYRSELEFKNKELTTHVMYLLKKNEFILSMSEKLKTIIPNIKVQNKRDIADVINELEKGSSTDIWKEFELRFQEVHNTFFENLNDVAGDLTPNELRLCAFLRLNMSTKDISSITYQSTKSIDMARHRLRKKLNIDKDENLVSYLSKL